MTKHDFIEEFAGLLDMDIQEAHLLLNSFSGAMVAEFLAHGKFSIRGLGRFAVREVTPVKKSTVSGTVYTPPGNKVIFHRGVYLDDDTVRIAVERVSMRPDDAVRFGRTFANVLGRACKEKRELVFNGFGRFTLEDGRYGFVPERSLEALMNREYQDLDEVVVSPQLRVVSAEGKRRTAPAAILLSTVIAALLLLVYLYGSQIQDSVTHSFAQLSLSLSPVSSPMAPKVISEVVTAVQGGGADSVVLEKGDYTIILATFRSGSTARKELRLLRSMGVSAYIWPAFSAGLKYHRVMTGRLSSREEASVHQKRLPEKIVGSSYIQHVIKRVVLHAEKEL